MFADLAREIRPARASIGHFEQSVANAEIRQVEPRRVPAAHQVDVVVNDKQVAEARVHVPLVHAVHDLKR